MVPLLERGSHGTVHRPLGSTQQEVRGECYRLSSASC